MKFPLGKMEILGIAVISIMTILSNAGGLGASGITIPFLMIFFGMPIKECVPLGNFFGFLSAFIRFALNFKQKHPRKPNRLVIDYEIAALTMPVMYLGTLFGVKIGGMLSEIHITIGLSCVLLCMSITTLMKAKKLWKDENREKV